MDDTPSFLNCTTRRTQMEYTVDQSSVVISEYEKELNEKMGR
jgi:hypothetical protein